MYKACHASLHKSPSPLINMVQVKRKRPRPVRACARYPHLAAVQLRIRLKNCDEGLI